MVVVVIHVDGFCLFVVVIDCCCICWCSRLHTRRYMKAIWLLSLCRDSTVIDWYGGRYKSQHRHKSVMMTFILLIYLCSVGVILLLLYLLL